MSNYISIRCPDLNDLGISECYLCDKKLDSETTSDHIIPDHIFDTGDQSRPQLPVHFSCNDQKSKDDQWFVKNVQLRSAFDHRAENEFSGMMNKAIEEKVDAYVVGKKLRNYKLARAIFDNTSWGLELWHGGNSMFQLKLSLEDVTRFERYVVKMCKGLFIRNVPLARPMASELIIVQYANLELRGKEAGFMDSIKSFVDASQATKFGQMWGNKISYIGSRVVETPDKGYVYIQFYSQFGILATFK